MSFATETIKPDSERFALVRIQPKRYLDSFTQVSGFVYSCELSNNIILYSVNVKIIGSSTEYTDFTYTHTNNVLTITPVDDIFADSDYVVVITHNIYTTGTKTRYTNGVTSGDEPPDAEWIPILQNYPDYSQSMKDITEGVFSLSLSTITLISDNRFFQKYLGVNDTFNNCAIDIWMCINNVENNKLVFSGLCTSASFSGTILSIECIDRFSKLKDTALFTNNGNGYISSGSSITSYPENELVGKPSVLVIGDMSPFTLSNKSVPQVRAESSKQMVHVSDGIRMTRDTPQTNDVNSTTLSMFVARFVGTAIKKMTFGTVTRCYREYTDGGVIDGKRVFSTYYHIQCSNFYGEIGDCLPDGLSGIEAFPMYVCYVGARTGPDGSTYDFVLYKQEWSWGTGTATMPTSGLTSNPTIPDNTYYSYAVVRKGVTSATLDSSLESFDMRYYAHGSVSIACSSPRVETVETIGGQTISALYIDFDPGDFYSVRGGDDMKFENLYCRFTSTTELTHAQAMELTIKASGLTVNSASFTQAASDLSAKVSFCVPVDKESNTTYLDVVQFIAKSTFSLVSVNNDREIEYSIIKNPSSITSSGSRDNSNVLFNSFSTYIDYNDIVSSINFVNPCFNYTNLITSPSGLNTETTSSSNKAIFLHGASKTITYKHCLKTIVNRKSVISAYLGEPKIVYTYKTSSLDLDTSLGQSLNVQNDGIIGETNTKDCLVVDISNSTSLSTIKLNEIRGVP